MHLDGVDAPGTETSIFTPSGLLCLRHCFHNAQIDPQFTHTHRDRQRSVALPIIHIPAIVVITVLVVFSIN